jgi:hypothetical protein
LVEIFLHEVPMALPPKGDPRRPLHLAIRSTRLLGILFLLLGSCGSAGLFMGRRNAGMAFGVVGVIGLYIAPGVAYLVFSIFLKERKFWAVLAALIVASVQLVFTLFLGATLGIFATKINGVGTPLAIMAIVVGLVALALAQLIYHLALSFKAIQYIPLEEQRGFAPVMIQHVQPPPPNPPDALPPA